jgi:L-ascorbate metabolism protein UlaG (beta-lactamase superfamily)
VTGGAVRVTFVNHATALIQIDGLNILTDPIWSERASPLSFAGPKRVRPPGLRFEDLPPIDAVLVSHNHYDHMDVPTLARLWREHHPRIFAGLGNAAFLAENGIEATDLEWWQSVPLAAGVELTSVPTQHFSSRGTRDRDATLWTGFVVKGPAGAVYFGGDTGYGPHFRAVRERLGPMRAALLPIGAYLPRWFMGPVHLAPEEAVQAARDLAAGTAVAIHFGTFRLADDGQDQAPVDLARALAVRGLSPEWFWVLGFGEGRDAP